MKFSAKVNKKSLYTGMVLFALFALLAYQFPYSGDDWAWGSSIGTGRLENLFRGYNGRYAGNLLVLLLTRCKLLQVLFVAGSMLLLSFAAKWFTRSSGLVTVLFSACLLLLVPKQIFVQSLSWTSGYSNYVPPILLIIIYFLMIKNIFEDGKLIYPKAYPWISFVMGFVGALFMENLTLYSIAVSFLIIAYVRFKFRKFFAVHMAHFAGCISGAVLMFTNSAYFSIANNTDSYRSTALSKGVLKTVASHCQVIYEQFFTNNLPMLLVISVLCSIATILYVRSSKDVRKCRISWGALAVNMVCLGILYAKQEFAYWVVAVGNPHSSNLTLLVMVLVAFLYCVGVLLTVWLCVEDRKYLLKLTLLLVSVPLVIAPLLVVNPIGPRCFFPPYALLIVFCATLLQYILETSGAGVNASKGILVSSAAVGAAMFVFFMSIYGTIHSYDVKREAYVQKQVEQGYEEITVCKLPYTSYVWYGDPTTEPWGERFKLFYGLEKETELTFLTYSEFNKWAEEFDAK